MGLRPYLVRQGDTLVRIAHREGFDASAAWAHARNADLHLAGRTPDVLHPGDLLWIPERTPRRGAAFSAGAHNRFSAALPSARVELQLLDDEHRPIAGERYEVRGLGAPLYGETAADGSLHFDAPVDVPAVEVVVAARGIHLRAQIGHLNPVSELSGAVARLEQLGYFRGTLGHEGGGPHGGVLRALQAFQRDAGLAPSGELTPATQRALSQRYGC